MKQDIMDIQWHKKTCRTVREQTDRQTDTQTHRQTDRQTENENENENWKKVNSNKYLVPLCNDLERLLIFGFFFWVIIALFTL